MSVATTPPPLHLEYPDAPFVEEFVSRYGTGWPDLTNHALHCYRQRGQASVSNWEDYCYLPLNAAVGYCEELGMDDRAASRNARLLVTAQAFLASHLIVELNAAELHDAWHQPCTGVIPFDDLMNVPTFCYYVDLTPIEEEAHGCGVFVSWEDRIGRVPTSGTSLHLIRGLRLPEPIDGEHFLAYPLEIPLLPGKTVRDCIYKFLDDGLMNGADADSIEAKEAIGGLELIIDDASRLVSLVSVVNRKLAYEEDLPKYFEPLDIRSGAFILPECTTLRV